MVMNPVEELTSVIDDLRAKQVQQAQSTVEALIKIENETTMARRALAEVRGCQRTALAAERLDWVLEALQALRKSHGSGPQS